MVAYLYANFVAKRLRSLYGEDGEERFFHHCLCPILQVHMGQSLHTMC